MLFLFTGPVPRFRLSRNQSKNRTRSNFGARSVPLAEPSGAERPVFTGLR